MIEAVSVGITYPQRGWVISDLDFVVRPGDRIALLGPSGSGKSTLLGLMGGAFPPHKGTLRRSIAPDRIGFVHQSNPLLRRRTVFDNVRMGLLPGRWSASDIKRRSVECLDHVGLLNLSSRRAGTLSGGEQQRLCLARVLAPEPLLVLADEPTGQLDATNSILVGRLLAKLSPESAVVVATHDESIASMFRSVWRSPFTGQISEQA